MWQFTRELNDKTRSRIDAIVRNSDNVDLKLDRLVVQSEKANTLMNRIDNLQQQMSMAHPNADTSATKEAIRMLRTELTDAVLDFHKLANTNPVAEINAKITDLTREVSRVVHQKVTRKISPEVLWLR